VSEPTLGDPPPEGVAFQLERVRELRGRDLFVRALFGASASAAAAGVTIAFGPRAGGIFLAFPAILAASVTLIEDEDTAAEAREDARGAIVGAGALVAFAAIGAVLFGVLPGGIVLALAAATWSLIALGTYWAVWSRRRASRPATRAER
jgi:hypothetical protein